MGKVGWEEFRESLEEKVACLILSALIFELLVLVVMIVFEYNKSTASDYFYLFSILALMLSTIYFAWHSLVNENAFELIAFTVMSTILNFHGLYQAITDAPFTVLHWVAILTFSSVQFFYYFSFYFAYNRFGWHALNEINSTNANLIRAYKLFETFSSVLKLDALLYCMTIAMYLYYVLVDWSAFDYFGISIGVGIFVALVTITFIGYCAVMCR
jgi:hypothetical protein